MTVSLRSQFLVTVSLIKFTISEMNGVAVAHHWPISKDNEAMGSGKGFKNLRAYSDTIKN